MKVVAATKSPNKDTRLLKLPVGSLEKREYWEVLELVFY